MAEIATSQNLSSLIINKVPSQAVFEQIDVQPDQLYFIEDDGIIYLSEIANADDLKAIEALTGTSGFLKKTAANTWTLDNSTYAGSSSAGGAANSVAKSLVLKINGGTTEGTSLYTFNGSAAKTLNIKPGNNISFNTASDELTITAVDTWIALSGATSSADGTAGYVSAPPHDGYNTKFLRADGTWAIPNYIADTHHTAYLYAGANNATKHAAVSAGTNIYLCLRENGTQRSAVQIKQGTNMTISSDANGIITFTAKDTTYSNFVKSGTDAAAGLVPSPGTTAGTTRFLREDGTWSVPSYTTNTDTKVTQTISSTENADYRILLSGTADDTTRAEGARKDTDFKYNPNTNTLKIGTGTLTATNYSGKAATAGTADSANAVAWDKVSGRPASVVTSVNGNSGAVTIAASDLGLTSVLNYVGPKTSLPNATSSTTYSTYNNGDVITVNYKEYVYVKGSDAASSSWVELGDEGSYKLKQTAVSSATAETTTATTFVYSVTQNENGVITVTTRPLPTYNNYEHPTTAGNKHIPSGGSSGQFLKYGGSSGTATWATLAKSDISDFSHSHGNITNAGAIGSNANYAVYTTTNGVLTAGSLETSAPNASGTATAFITSVSQDSKGKITATKANLDTSGTWSGTISTTVNTTDNLYLIGVKSDATTALLYDTGITVQKGKIVVGAREVTTAPSAETGVDRIVITPYYRNDGPWRIVSADTSANAFLKLFYGNTELIKIQNDGTFKTDLKANITGTATSWTNAQKVYVALGTVSKDTTIQGGSTTASAIGIDGVLGVQHGGTGLTTSTTVNAVVIGNSSTATDSFQTVATASGAFYATGANAKPQFGTLPIAQGGTNTTTFTDGCAIIPSTTSSIQSLVSSGLKITGITTDNITLSPYTAGKSMTLSSGAGAMNISTETGTITIQTNGASGGDITIKNANNGKIVIESAQSSIDIVSADATSVISGTSISLAATTAAFITGTQGTTITSGTDYATVFKINTTEYGEFNKNGMFQLNDTGTQSTHKLYVNGDSAFNGKISFGAQASNIITEKAYMIYNDTDASIDFIFP